MRETKEVERLRLPPTPRLSPPSGMPPELDQPGLIGMKFQPELREPLAKISPEPLRILLMLETNSEIVGLCRPWDYADRCVNVLVDGAVRRDWSA